MDSRHELPPLLPKLQIQDVQTSVLSTVLERHLKNQKAQFNISQVLSQWLQLDPVQVTMAQQIRISAQLQILGCTRIRTKSGIFFIPPVRLQSPSLQRRKIKPLGEPLSTDDPLRIFTFGTGSALMTAILLAFAGIGIVVGLMGLVVWARTGIAILPLGITF